MLFRSTALQKKHLQACRDQFGMADAHRIKEIEKITNHDVKAVEYYLKEQLDQAGAGHLKEWIHFGLTSQDINNTAIPLSWKHCLEEVYLPSLLQLNSLLLKQARQWKSIPLLARTHGQPASPTRLGKEWKVFHERIQGQIQLLSHIPYSAKFGGATGNFKIGRAHV